VKALRGAMSRDEEWFFTPPVPQANGSDHNKPPPPPSENGYTTPTKPSSSKDTTSTSHLSINELNSFSAFEGPPTPPPPPTSSNYLQSSSRHYKTNLSRLLVGGDDFQDFACLSISDMEVLKLKEHNDKCRVKVGTAALLSGMEDVIKGGLNVDDPADAELLVKLGLSLRKQQPQLPRWHQQEQHDKQDERIDEDDKSQAEKRKSQPRMGGVSVVGGCGCVIQ